MNGLLRLSTKFAYLIENYSKSKALFIKNERNLLLEEKFNKYFTSNKTLKS